MVWVMASGIRALPGEPITISTEPSRITRVGAIVVMRVIHAGASARSSSSGVIVAPELLRKKPSTATPAPKVLLLVTVTATALPSLSTTEMCVVSPPDGPVSPAGVVAGVPAPFDAAPYGSKGAQAAGDAAASNGAAFTGAIVAGARPVPTSARRCSANVLDTAPRAGTGCQRGSKLPRLAVSPTRSA